MIVKQKIIKEYSFIQMKKSYKNLRNLPLSIKVLPIFSFGCGFVTSFGISILFIFSFLEILSAESLASGFTFLSLIASFISGLFMTEESLFAFLSPTVFSSITVLVWTDSWFATVLLWTAWLFRTALFVTVWSLAAALSVAAWSLATALSVTACSLPTTLLKQLDL